MLEESLTQAQCPLHVASHCLLANEGMVLYALRMAGFNAEAVSFGALLSGPPAGRSPL